MDTITVKLIESFDPCQNGLDNFKNKYPDFTDSFVNLLKLEDIPYSDKIWLATKIVPLKTLQMWSVLCAESVLPNYERLFPNDSRIRDCLEINKKYLNGEATLDELTEAAFSTRSAAESTRSTLEPVRWSPAESAWLAAESAWSASWSATESVTRSAVDSAWLAALSAWSEREQEDLNLSILMGLL